MRLHIIIALLAIAMIALLCPGAFAQDEDAASEAPPEPKESSPDEAPVFSGTVDQQIAAIQARIDELQAQVDELVFVKESEQRETLKRQIRALKRQLGRLLLQKAQSTKSQEQRGEDQIRKKYGRIIQGIETQKAKKRRETIDEMEGLLQTHEDSRLAADILFRLGMLYFEDDHYNYQRRLENYVSDVNNLVEGGADETIGGEPRVDYSRAVSMFQQIVDNYPDFYQADFALYMLAFCASAMDDPQKALQSYQTLIAKYPNSPYIPESRIRMGEILFDDNRMEEAIAEYLKVLEYKDSNYYDKALFKLGWSYYRLTVADPQSLQTAIDYFTKLLDYYVNRPKARLRGGDDLRQESIDYIAISFTDMEDGGFAAAVGFIDNHPKYKWNKDILGKMVEVYFETDRYDMAERVIEERIKRWPNDPENPQIHLKAVDALVNLGRYEEAIKVGERIAELYGPDSAWGQANKERVATVSKTQKKRAKLLFNSATYHHEMAQRAKTEQGLDAARPRLEKAAVSYERFLADYPNDKASYEATFNLAEVYFDLSRFDKASDNYKKVIAQRKDKDLFYKAVKNNMIAREKIFIASPGWPVKPQEKVVVGDQGKGQRADIKTVPLSPNAQAWVASMEGHMEQLPNDKDNPQIMFKIGEVYFYHGQFDKAVGQFRNLIAKYPNSEGAKVGMNLTIQALDRQGNYEELRKVAAEYKNRVSAEVVDEEKGLTNVEVLGQIEATAGAKIAEQKIKEGQLEAGINEYLALANKNPRSEKAPIALNNAAATYRQLGKIEKANELYIRVAREYPKFEMAKKNLFLAATEYMKLIDVDQAISTYTLYSNLYPDDEAAKDALFNSALLREANKEYAEAISLFQQYAVKYPDSPDTPEVAFNIARLYEKMDNDAGAEMALQEFTSTYKDAVLLTEAYVKWGNLAKKRGAYDEATRHYLQAAAVYTQAAQIDPKAGAGFAAEAKFNLADMEYQIFSGIQLQLPETVMEKLLISKAESFKKLRAAYTEIVQLGDFTWATAALYMLGKINKDFAETLFKAPIPDDYSPEEQDLYIVKLEEQAFPLKQNSIKAFELNIQKGIAEKTMNEWIAKSYDELKAYKPDLVEPKYELYVYGASPSLPTPQFGVAPTATPAPATQPPTSPTAPADAPKEGEK